MVALPAATVSSTTRPERRQMRTIVAGRGRGEADKRLCHDDPACPTWEAVGTLMMRVDKREVRTVHSRRLKNGARRVAVQDEVLIRCCAVPRCAESCEGLVLVNECRGVVGWSLGCGFRCVHVPEVCVVVTTCGCSTAAARPVFSCARWYQFIFFFLIFFFLGMIMISGRRPVLPPRLTALAGAVCNALDPGIGKGAFWKQNPDCFLNV